MSPDVVNLWNEQWNLLQAERDVSDRLWERDHITRINGDYFFFHPRSDELHGPYLTFDGAATELWSFDRTFQCNQ